MRGVGIHTFLNVMLTLGSLIDASGTIERDHNPWDAACMEYMSPLETVTLIGDIGPVRFRNSISRAAPTVYVCSTY